MASALSVVAQGIQALDIPAPMGDVVITIASIGSMRNFLDSRKTSQSDEIGVEITKLYVELEYPIEDSTVGVLYLIPKDANSITVATCWNYVFDDLIEDLDEDTLETVIETWPTLAQLLYNGMKDRYQEGALIKFEDLDYGDHKWFVASIAGNISFDSIDEILSDRTQEVISVVFAQSMKLITELNENEPSALNAFGRGLARGIGYAVEAFLGI